ncbi:Gfo/Idh/MocA family oxidoreductase [Tessaracoccus coleopterorum]|uniref:Gfo/Idh/MocA family oxidoreductase n=1 Tax=Tessaracoccus coleopterorum TaxID=2714950 RepID=UPI001E636627|nr:Gfo/Idh/MocA family oxidoreductase [Tessaracoccus coleopterorum]
MRSNTRDPRLADPTGIPSGTIFTQTLIHDFDTLNWLNPGAAPVSVYAQAGALVRPDFADAGLLDTALVTIRYSNGAMAMADASFQAVYGYDVRAEVFGSGGLVTAGHQSVDDSVLYGPAGIAIDTARSDTDLLWPSYRDELAAFAAAVRGGARTGATGADARSALQVALAAIESHATNRPVEI